MNIKQSNDRKKDTRKERKELSREKWKGIKIRKGKNKSKKKKRTSERKKGIKIKTNKNIQTISFELKWGINEIYRFLRKLKGILKKLKT